MANEQLRITDSARSLLSSARAYGQRFGFGDPAPSHILITLKASRRSVAHCLLEEIGIDLEALCSAVENVYIEADVHAKQAESASSIMTEAQSAASRLGTSFIGTEHLILASLLAGSSIVESALNRLHLSANDVGVRAEGRIQEMIARGAAARYGKRPGEKTVAEWVREMMALRRKNEGGGGNGVRNQ